MTPPTPTPGPPTPAHGGRPGEHHQPQPRPRRPGRRWRRSGDFLLRSLDDLEREHDAGDVDDVDYETLKDDYTARAARTIRAIELAPGPRGRGPPAALAGGGWLVTVAAVAAFAVLAGRAGGPGVGPAGAPATRSPATSARPPAPSSTEALSLAGRRRYDEAIAVYDDCSPTSPTTSRRMTYKGWIQFQSGDGQGVVTLIDAAELDPEYPADPRLPGRGVRAGSAGPTPPRPSSTASTPSTRRPWSSRSSRPSGNASRRSPPPRPPRRLRPEGTSARRHQASVSGGAM